VSTGVEASPGHKDPRKLRRFIEAAREAADAVADRAIDLVAEEESVAGVNRPWDWQLDE
jgi:hypothetical protein